MTNPISFPPVEEPRVSIVVVTFGQWGWVERALRTLADRTPPIYEVVIVDNDSPDGTGERLEAVLDGATIVRAGRNLGFGVGNDLGVLHVRSPNVVLLNSDCLVEPDWLPPLLDRIESDDSIGAVVGQLLDLDGGLQEAGSLLDRDASTSAYRRGSGPRDPEGSFARDLVFGSAGFMLIRRSVFDAVGGFDAVFSPAYYEDVDLALAIESQGFRMVFEPHARARHVREASTGSGTSGTLMKAHRPIVQERWAHRLAALPSLADADRLPHRVFATRDAGAPDRVLVIGAPSTWISDLGLRAARQPTIRWSLVALEPDLAAAVDGLELVGGGLTEELERRRFHYSVVCIGPDASHDTDALVARTQPQAVVLRTLEELDGQAELRAAHAVRVVTPTS